MKVRLRSARTQFLLALGIASLASVGLYMFGAAQNQSLEYGFLTWNLFLAWLPLVFAMWLTRVLQAKLWSSWEALIASALWLLFLPNSFYIISDLIHLPTVDSDQILYASVMFLSFVLTGIALGFSSLHLIHLQLEKRFSAQATAGWLGVVLLLCSVAIFIGRDLRWNSWDILFNPGGILFDMSDRFMHPAEYPEMFIAIGSFFVLLATMYYLLWCGIRLAHTDEAAKSRTRIDAKL